ncbi:MAG: peptidoglycan DD-metalloendopeptidase family protein [bacterium]
MLKKFRIQLKVLLLKIKLRLFQIEAKFPGIFKKSLLAAFSVFLFFIVLVGIIILKPNKTVDLKIANISSSSATITWTTVDPTSGQAIVTAGKAPSLLDYIFGKKILDDRDATGLAIKRNTHFITIQDLAPETAYYITTGSSSWKTNQTGNIKFTTQAVAENFTAPAPLYGKVDLHEALDTTNDVTDAIVYLTSTNDAGDPVLTATLVNTDQNFVVNNPVTSDEQNTVVDVVYQGQVASKEIVLTPDFQELITVDRVADSSSIGLQQLAETGGSGGTGSAFDHRLYDTVNKTWYKCDAFFLSCPSGRTQCGISTSNISNCYNNGSHTCYKESDCSDPTTSACTPKSGTSTKNLFQWCSNASSPTNTPKPQPSNTLVPSSVTKKFPFNFKTISGGTIWCASTLMKCPDDLSVDCGISAPKSNPGSCTAKSTAECTPNSRCSGSTANGCNADPQYASTYTRWCKKTPSPTYPPTPTVYYPSPTPSKIVNGDCSGNARSGSECNQFGNPDLGNMWSCKKNVSGLYKCIETPFPRTDSDNPSCFLDIDKIWKPCGCSESKCQSQCVNGESQHTSICDGCGQKFTCSCTGVTPQPTTPTNTPLPTICDIAGCGTPTPTLTSVPDNKLYNVDIVYSYDPRTKKDFDTATYNLRVTYNTKDTQNNTIQAVHVSNMKETGTAQPCYSSSSVCTKLASLTNAYINPQMKISLYKNDTLLGCFSNVPINIVSDPNSPSNKIVKMVDLLNDVNFVNCDNKVQVTTTITPTPDMSDTVQLNLNMIYDASQKKYFNTTNYNFKVNYIKKNSDGTTVTTAITTPLKNGNCTSNSTSCSQRIVLPSLLKSNNPTMTLMVNNGDLACYQNKTIEVAFNLFPDGTKEINMDVNLTQEKSFNDCNDQGQFIDPGPCKQIANDFQGNQAIKSIGNKFGLSVLPTFSFEATCAGRTDICDSSQSGKICCANALKNIVTEKLLFHELMHKNMKTLEPVARRELRATIGEDYFYPANCMGSGNKFVGKDGTTRDAAAIINPIRNEIKSTDLLAFAKGNSELASNLVTKIVTGGKISDDITCKGMEWYRGPGTYPSCSIGQASYNKFSSSLGAVVFNPQNIKNFSSYDVKIALEFPSSLNSGLMSYIPIQIIDLIPSDCNESDAYCRIPVNFNLSSFGLENSINAYAYLIINGIPQEPKNVFKIDLNSLTFDVDLRGILTSNSIFNDDNFPSECKLSDQLVLPVEGAKVKYNWQDNKYPTIQIEVPESTNVKSVSSGTVIYQRNIKNTTTWEQWQKLALSSHDQLFPKEYGNILIINNGSFNIIYTNLKEIYVAEGDCINAGSVIGLSGSTGKISGTGFNLEMRKLTPECDLTTCNLEVNQDNKTQCLREKYSKSGCTLNPQEKIIGFNSTTATNINSDWDMKSNNPDVFSLNTGVYNLQQNQVIITEEGIKSLDLFNDTNSNKIFDEGESTFKLFPGFQGTKLEVVTINPGWNLIPLNYSSSFFKSSEDILSLFQANTKDTSLAYYDNGEWKIQALKNDNNTLSLFGASLPVEKDSGIFVRSESNQTVNFINQTKVFDDYALSLATGWNIFTIPESSISAKQYTAYSFLNECSTLHSNCSFISTYNNKLDNPVIRKGSNLFGLDFPLSSEKLYIVKVE